MFEFENNYWNLNKIVCGVDEVGRGCLAGPIVVVALILNPGVMHSGLKDSKLLTKIQLENIYGWIIDNSVYAVGISHHRIIDQKNIYATTQLTMKKALIHLLHSQRSPAVVVIDAMPLTLANTPYSDIPIESWVKGESKSASIAAASIVAKVIRDKLVKKMHHAFPVYQLDNHKGYGTAAHIIALHRYKASVIHRKTFIKNLKGSENVKSEQQNCFC